MDKKNPIGQKFNMLTVISQAESKKGKRYWNCQCECGNLKQIATDKLGITKSCGCLLHKSHYEDLTNQIFGFLKVIEYNGKDKSGKILWKCECLKCGTFTQVRANDLKAGKVVSCGCYGAEKRLEKYREYLLEKEPEYRKDLTGQKFNKLTVMYFNNQLTKEKNANRATNKRAVWHCICECGNECDVDSSSLINGGIKSCGCLISAGELKIRELLVKNNIPFKTQYRFENCILPSGIKASFDFYVQDKYIIEYDGEQHYLQTPQGFYSQEKIDKIHKHDELKNQYCKNNNIPLIRIPYTKLKDLQIFDLILESSNYIV